MDIKELQKANETLTAQATALEKERDDLKASNESLEKEVQTAKDDAAEKQKTVDDLAQKVVEKDEEISNLQAENETLKGDKQKSDDELKDLKENFDDKVEAKSSEKAQDKLVALADEAGVPLEQVDKTESEKEEGKDRDDSVQGYDRILGATKVA